jgi:carbonic anhydrase
MSHRSAVSLWPIDSSWTTHRITTLGGVSWSSRNGQRVVDGTVTHLVDERDVSAVLVVGHTQCEVIADLYERWLVSPTREPAGIEARFGPLESVVDDAVDAGVVDQTVPLRTARHRLVECTVVRGVELLAEQLPAAITVAGYVHDQDGVYGTFPGKQYLVAVDGETDTAELDARLPDDESIPVGSLCQ